MTSELAEAWRMGDAANRFLLDHLPDACFSDRYGARTRTVAGQFAHMHAVRLRWLNHAAPELVTGVAGFPGGARPTRSELVDALEASAGPVARFLEVCEAEGRVPKWNGPPATFLGYLIAHEAHHRGLVMVAARLSGHRLPDEVVYGQWRWGKRR